MNAREFVDAITGKEFRFNRTCLATGRVSDHATVTPSEPVHNEVDGRRSSSILVTTSFHCYDNCDLFTYDYGVYVAVVKSGAGHLWVDRFEPVDSPRFPFSPLVEPRV